MARLSSIDREEIEKSGKGKPTPQEIAGRITNLLIWWVMGITAGFILLVFIFYAFLCDNQEQFLELIKILIPIITFLIGVISSLGYVNYKINDNKN